VIGSKLAHYEASALIGAGGMGRVYEAADVKLGRRVAIEVLPEALARDGDRIARLEREARVLAALNHPSIATIHGLEHVEGQTLLVMELVTGETLADRMSKGPLPLTEALQLGAQIAGALEAAHDAGIIHRDLKPANIKVTRGAPRPLGRRVIAGSAISAWRLGSSAS
jgi:serine/threonine-protein kinase